MATTDELLFGSKEVDCLSESHGLISQVGLFLER